MSGLLYSNANANIPTIKVKIASSLKSINIHGQNLKRHLVETGRKKIYLVRAPLLLIAQRSLGKIGKKDHRFLL